MRIISGILKNRRFKMPKNIRPTQDKVRKALFDILRGNIEGSIFLDLFAGSGSVGLEAFSRGAKEVILVENGQSGINAIRENLESLSPEERVSKISLLAADAFRAIDSLVKQGKRFDIIFADPPYYKELANKTLKKLTSYDILSANGFLIMQHHKKDLLPKEAGFLRLLRQEKYGDTILTFYQKTF